MDRHLSPWMRMAQWIAVPLVVLGVTLASRAADANVITACLLLLVAVLSLSTWGGWAVGAAASVAATLCLNYFFLPPTGTFSIEAPANWLDLACFLAASTLVSRLVTRARRGGHVAGVLVATEPTAPLAVLEPSIRLLALAVERERLLRERAHLEAVRESDTLKTALLRAVSHDLRTPLTSILLELASLQRRLAGQPEALASLRGLSLQQERLTRRIDNLLALARLEAGVARPHSEPTPAGSLFRLARESLALVLEGREVQVCIQPGCPDLWTDPSMSLEVLVNLLENAARAAPPETPIELAAGSMDGRVRIEVRDRGPGLPARADGEALSEGLGLQIARSLAAADGGSIDLLDRPGGGTIARLDLPKAPEPEEELAG